MIFGEEKKKFCQRLVVSAEGPFITVCIIMRAARGRVAYKVLGIRYRKLRLCLDFWKPIDQFPLET